MLRVIALLALLPFMLLADANTASAAPGCGVTRLGTTAGVTDPVTTGTSSWYLWVNLLHNNCDPAWPDNSPTSTNDWIDITVPAGAGVCYDADVAIRLVYTNDFDVETVIITSVLERENPLVQAGWSQLDFKTSILSPTNLADVFTLRNPTVFEGVNGEPLRVRSYWKVEGVSPAGFTQITFKPLTFRVWEADCGGV